MEEKNINFVAKYYQKGAFSTETALHKMGFRIKKKWSRFRIAAIIAGVVAFTAVASIIIRNEYAAQQPSESVMPVEEVKATHDITAVRAIDFDDAPLPVVVGEIKKVYGVEIDGLPEDAASLHLTLHYEGNVTDLVETINEILGTHLIIKE